MPFDPKDPDTKKALDEAIRAAVEEANAKHDEDVSGLKEKVEELLGKNRKLTTQLRNKDSVDPAELERIETQLAETEGKLAQALKDITLKDKEVEKLTKTLAQETGFTKKLLVENGLTEALAAAGVKDPVLLKAAKAMMTPLAEVVVDGDSRVARIGDKAMADYMKEWSQTDEARSFISAGPNNGGGSSGSGNGGGSGGGKTVNREAFNAMSQVERAAFSKEGGKVVDA